MKKILFVYDSMMIGGTTTALLSLMSAIDRSRYDISLLLYTNAGALMGEIPNYVHLLPPAYRRSRFLSSKQRKVIRTIFNGRAFLALLSAIKYRNTQKGNFRKILMHYGMKAQVALSRVVEEQYDYAIGFMEGWSDLYVASNKINANKKYVWIHPQYKSCYLIPEIDRKMFKSVDGIALVSECCMKQFFDFFPELKNKTYIVPNIISRELLIKKAGQQIVDIKKAKLNFCTVCRCDIQVKGLDRLLKAFYELKKQGLCKDVLWHYIGGGDELEQFRREVERLKMEDTIISYGNKLNPLPYVRQMDVFVLASRYEGKPMCVTEAQILGIPCMVTDYDSAISQVEDNYTGKIMENNSESIYENIKRVVVMPELLKTWKRSTVKKIYSNENDVEKFYKLIDCKNSENGES